MTKSLLVCGFMCASLWLTWDWQPQGPVRFEVWRATYVPLHTNVDGTTWAGWKWAGGTNVPEGFTLWTNVGCGPVPIAPGKVTEFFIVRAVNNAGVSDWPP